MHSQSVGDLVLYIDSLGHSKSRAMYFIHCICIVTFYLECTDESYSCIKKVKMVHVDVSKFI